MIIWVKRKKNGERENKKREFSFSQMTCPVSMYSCVLYFLCSSFLVPNRPM